MTSSTLSSGILWFLVVSLNIASFSISVDLLDIRDHYRFHLRVLGAQRLDTLVASFRGGHSLAGKSCVHSRRHMKVDHHLRRRRRISSYQLRHTIVFPSLVVCAFYYCDLFIYHDNSPATGPKPEAPYSVELFHPGSAHTTPALVSIISTAATLQLACLLATYCAP